MKIALPVASSSQSKSYASMWYALKFTVACNWRSSQSSVSSKLTLLSHMTFTIAVITSDYPWLICLCISNCIDLPLYFQHLITPGEEEEKLEEDEIEVDDKEEIDVDDEDEMDDSEIINPYEEVDPLNRPPPNSDSKPEAVAAPVGHSTLHPLPHIRRFFGTFYIGEGSSATAFNTNHCKVSAPRPLGRNCDTLHSKLDSTLREQILSRSKMEQLVTDLSRQFQEIKEEFAQVPYDPAIDPAMRARSDDPYVMARDAATNPARDVDDSADPNDPQPSEPCGSPCDPQ
ncbi:hypothetical protein Tco_1272463 [Tanacetum coccineum]